VVDFSQLGATDDIAQIDTGVTSGADPSEWDPINIDDQGHVDSCTNNTAASKSGDKGAAAVCQSASPATKPTS